MDLNMALNREEYLSILSIISHMAHSDGKMHPAEKKVLLATFKAGKVTTEEQQKMRESTSLEQMLSEIQSEEAKHALVDLLALIAGADGQMQSEEHVFITKVMQKVGMDLASHEYFTGGDSIDIKKVRANAMKILEHVRTLAA